MKKFYVAGIFFLLSTLYSVSAHAQQPPEIYISEINWAGSALSTADEWIELFNPNGESVDISGWILTGSATSGDALSLEDGTIIKAHSALLISNYPKDNEKTSLNVAPDLVSSALSLPNTDLNILLTTPDGIVVDEVHFLGRPSAGSSNPFASMERDLVANTWFSAQTSINLLDTAQFGTPGIFETTNTFSEIVTNESDPNPEPLACSCTCAESSSSSVSETIITNNPEEPEDDVIQIETDDQVMTPDDTFETSVDTQVIINDDEPNMSYAINTVLINEFVSDPTDGTEWIELYFNGVTSIDLSLWSVQDASNKITLLKGEILPNTFYVVENPSGKLNNDGDTIRLLDPSQNVIDSVVYGAELPAPKKGESLARDENQIWRITTDITKNSSNKFSYEDANTNETIAIKEPENSTSNSTSTKKTVSSSTSSTANNSHVSKNAEPYRVVAVAQAAEISEKTTKPASTKAKTTSAVNTTTTRTGIITATPGTFTTQTAYIDGIQIYSYSADWPTLEVGDMVRVTGVLSENRGEERLKISSLSDIEIIDHTQLIAKYMTINEMINEKTGTFVQISGSIYERDGTKLLLQDSSGQVVVIANEKTNMSWSDFNSSDLTISGIVRHVNGETRLYPRTKNDVQETIYSQIPETQLSAGIVSQKNKWKPWAGATLFLVTIFTMLFWYIKSKSMDQTLQTA